MLAGMVWGGIWRRGADILKIEPDPACYCSGVLRGAGKISNVYIARVVISIVKKVSNV